MILMSFFGEIFLYIALVVGIPMTLFIICEGGKDKRRKSEFDDFLKTIPHNDLAVGPGGFNSVAFDDEQGRLYVIKETFTSKDDPVNVVVTDIIASDAIESVSVIENGKTVYKKGRTNVTGMLLGGAVAGTAGAILGGMPKEMKKERRIHSMRVAIACNDGCTVYIDCLPFLEGSCSTDGAEYLCGRDKARIIRDAIEKRMPVNTPPEPAGPVLHGISKASIIQDN